MQQKTMPPLEKTRLPYTDILSAMNGIQASLDALDARMDAIEENVGFIKTVCSLTYSWRMSMGCWARSIYQRQSRDFESVMGELAAVREVLDEEEP